MKTYLLATIWMALGATASVHAAGITADVVKYDQNGKPVPSASAHAAATTADVVYELPAGATASTYVRQANSFRQWGADNIKEEIVSGAISEIAVADGKLYVANMLQYGTTGYIVGNIDGDKVTFTFPQTVEKNGNFLQVMILDENVTETPGETPLDPTVKRYTFTPSSTQTIEYTLSEGVFTATPDTRLGFIEDNTWNGYGEYNQTFTPFDNTLVTPPEDAKPIVMSLAYAESYAWLGKDVLYKFASAKKKDNKIYISGLSTRYPEAWFEGTIDGDHVTFTSGQLLGYTDGIEYFCGGIDKPVWNDAYKTWEHNYSVTPSITMAYNESDGSIKCLDKNDIMTVNSSATIYNYGTMYAHPEFISQPDQVDPVPATPLFTGVGVWENGMSPHLSFQVMPLNTKGQLLVKEDMGFEIEVEGKTYVFNAYDYWIDEDMTFIPWSFQGPNFDMLPNGYTSIYFQEEHYMRDVRVYAVYKHDGQTYRSAALDPENPSTGVQSITDTASPVIAEQYFDLSGNRLTEVLSTGLCIVRRIHADGTVSTSKTVR